MKYYGHIDYRASMDWGLNLQQAALFDWLYSLSTWADTTVIGGEVYYFAARQKACKEIPLVTDKPDTMYRHFKALSDNGLIKIMKIENRDFIAFTDKANSWGRHSEPSEKSASNLEEIHETDSEKSATYKNIIKDNNIRDKEDSKKIESSLFPESDPNVRRLFKNSLVNNFEFVQKKFDAPEFSYINLNHYFNAVLDWSDMKGMKRTADGWLATIRSWIRKDLLAGKLVTIKTEEDMEQMDKELLDWYKL